MPLETRENFGTYIEEKAWNFFLVGNIRDFFFHPPLLEKRNIYIYKMKYMRTINHAWLPIPDLAGKDLLELRIPGIDQPGRKIREGLSSIEFHQTPFSIWKFYPHPHFSPEKEETNFVILYERVPQGARTQVRPRRRRRRCNMKSGWKKKIMESTDKSLLNIRNHSAKSEKKKKKILYRPSISIRLYRCRLIKMRCNWGYASEVIAAATRRPICSIFKLAFTEELGRFVGAFTAASGAPTMVQS